MCRVDCYTAGGLQLQGGDEKKLLLPASAPQDTATLSPGSRIEKDAAKEAGLFKLAAEGGNILYAR